MQSWKCTHPFFSVERKESEDSSCFVAHLLVPFNFSRVNLSIKQLNLNRQWRKVLNPNLISLPFIAKTKYQQDYQ